MQPLAPALARTGRRATELGLRLVMHPDQFVVLSSDSPDVVANSVKILQMHADLMDLLEQPRSPWALLEIHAVCLRAGVPMVFDAHHHIVHDKLASYDDPSVAAMLAAARATWPEPAHQVVHISNGRDGFNDRQHAALITTMPAAYVDAPWIEIEAKSKEEAIDGLRGWPQPVAPAQAEIHAERRNS